MGRICSVVGARPNFMKMAPVLRELQRRGISQFLIHSGQHYDHNMSQVFFDELGLPEPDICLNVGSDTHARQTARVMEGVEDACMKYRPDLVLVAGDVNSTLAAALVAAKVGTPLAHVEAGLRSFDRGMPEEINRVVTDHLSELLFTTEQSANLNLRKEGISESRIHFTGNCMVDTLFCHVEEACRREPWHEFGLRADNYAILTLHRPSNVEDPAIMTQLSTTIRGVAARLPIVFPVHPRTRQYVSELGSDLNGRLTLCDPLPYLRFLGLIARARMVLTDSGGIQEETTALRVPCLTLRENTERPVTLVSGSNRLVGRESGGIIAAVDAILSRPPALRSDYSLPPLWDGSAAIRIVSVLANWLSSHASAERVATA